MKNLNVRKKIMMLAMLNTFALTGINSTTSYAVETKEEAIDITDFNDIRDIVVAKDEEVAIKNKLGKDYEISGVLKAGEYLKLISDVENDYEVLYKGKLAYVNKQYVYESTLDDYNTNITAHDIVTAIDKTNIKAEPNSDSEKIGTLRANESLRVTDKKDGYYEVLYKDGVGYINENKVSYSEPFIKSGYTICGCCIYETEGYQNILADLPAEEFVRIYDETEIAYYVEVNGVTGYMNKNNIQLFNDKYIVVDISDQMVEMYDNNELLVSSAVVTGRPPENSTPTGIYYIGDRQYEVSDHRYLVGPGYKSYVTYMMKFVDNIGFHDSEVGVDDTGKSHGWRNASEYGGNTYKTNGSHGCVNMPNDAAEAMYDIVKPYVKDKGFQVKVLVKE